MHDGARQWAFRRIDPSWTVVFLLLLVATTVVSTPKSSRAMELSYYLAVKVKPIVGEATPRSGIPRGPDWIADRYVTPIGVRVPIVRRRTPLLSLPMDSIRHVIVYRSPWDAAMFPDSTTVEARLVVEQKKLRREFETIATKFQGHYWLLVVADGRSIDLPPVEMNLADSVPGGSFSSEEKARDFYSPIEDRLRVAPTRPEDVQSARRFLSKSWTSSLWHLKCDKEFREALERKGYDTGHLMKEFSDRLSELDCSKEPADPTVP